MTETRKPKSIKGHSLRKPTATRRASDIIARVQKTAERHAGNRAISGSGLNARDWTNLFQAMIEAESSYNPKALSPKGAYGLGQLMPDTASALGVDPKDISQNLDGAARYLLAQLSEFQDVDLALAAYNAGPHRVQQYSGVPPFSETRSYIARIHRIRARLSGRLLPQSTVKISNAAPARPTLLIPLN